MKTIKFIENTRIRTSINDIGEDKVIGFINKGKEIKVLDEIKFATKAFSYEVANKWVNTNEFYTCKNGWYYWRGATADFIINESLEKKSLTTDWGSESYNEKVMNWGIEQLGIIKTFWKEGVTGRGIRVAVFDGRNNSKNINEINSINYVNQEEISPNHAIKCSSIIGGNNLEQIVGVAPEVEILSANILTKMGYNIDQLSFLKALDWAENNQAKIISISQEFIRPIDFTNAVNFEKIHKRIIELNSKGILIVCASGNVNTNFNSYPAYFEETISVSACTSDFKYFNSTKNDRIDICAPGHGILADNNGTNVLFNGTSAAAAFLSGVFALIIQKTGYTSSELINKIRQGNRDQSVGFGIISKNLINTLIS